MNLKSNVTVIIPCFNDGQYIMKALHSIYTQTLLPECIIIVDDGSNLETNTILKNIRHALVQVVYQENKGVSNARNTAIELAQTDYIVNLDADDYFEPSFIEKAVGILNNNKHIVAVSSYCRVFKDKTTLEVIEPKGGKLKDFILINNSRASSMFLKKSWEKVGGFDEKMQGGYEDWEFWISILKGGEELHIIQEVLSSYRLKKNSRDWQAITNHDFELRKYIFSKHEEVYKLYVDFFADQLLLQNSLLRNSIYKIKNSKEYKIGSEILAPFRFLKNKVIKK